MNYFLQRSLLFCLWGCLLVACSGKVEMPPPSMPTASASLPPPAAVSEVTTDTLPTLVLVEREASITGNLPLLTSLWAEDGRIVDGRGSVQTDDDYVWQGRAALLDRYIVAVFPAPPPALAPSELADATLTVEGDQATLINGGDRWHFVQREGRWWLLELVYSAP